MKAPIFRAHVRPHSAGPGWQAALAMPEALSLYGCPHGLPMVDSSRAEAMQQAIELAAVYQHERDPETGDFLTNNSPATRAGR